MSVDIRGLRKSHRALVQVFRKLEHAGDGLSRRLLVNELYRRLALELEAHNIYLASRSFGPQVGSHRAGLLTHAFGDPAEHTADFSDWIPKHPHPYVCQYDSRRVPAADSPLVV